MKTKFISLFLLLTMMLTFTACGGGGSSGSAGSGTAETSATETSLPEGVIDLTGGEETVLYDDDDVKLSITGYEITDDSWLVNLAVVNNTDQEIDVEAADLVANGYFYYYAQYVVLAEPGTTTEDAVSFSVSSLEAEGIEKMAEVNFSLSLEYRDTSEEIFVSDTLTCAGPDYGYEQPAQHADVVLYDQDGILIEGFKGIGTDGSSSYPAINFYVENNSDQKIGIGVSSVVADETVYENSSWNKIPAGCKDIYSVRLAKSDTEIDDWSVYNELKTSLYVKVDGEEYPAEEFDALAE